MSSPRKIVKKTVVPAPVEEEVVVAASAAAAVEEEHVEETASEMTADSSGMTPAESLMSHISEIEKLLAKLKKDARSALKGKLPKRAGSRPTGETPGQVAHWNEFVQATHEMMKSEGWPEFTTKKGDVFAAAEKNEDDHWVFSDTKKLPLYRHALAFAGFRKQNGEYEDPAAEEREAAKAEKAKQKEEEKQRKAEEREAEKKRKAEEREAEKKRKAEEREAEKERKKAEKAAAAKPSTAKPSAAKPAAAKPANGGAGKPEKPSPAASKKPAPPAKKVEEEEEDEDSIIPWTHAGKNYFRSSRNECWHMTAGGKQGKWAGVYDAEKDEIDASAEEPEVEFE